MIKQIAIILACVILTILGAGAVSIGYETFIAQQNPKLIDGKGPEDGKAYVCRTGTMRYYSCSKQELVKEFQDTYIFSILFFPILLIKPLVFISVALLVYLVYRWDKKREKKNLLQKLP